MQIKLFIHVLHSMLIQLNAVSKSDLLSRCEWNDMMIDKKSIDRNRVLLENQYHLDRVCL